MTITGFRIKNFMAFADSDWISIKPITLIFGQNSSGKSSILRALMFLKQSCQASNFTFESEYGIDLGSYLNIAHGASKSPYKTSKKRITFEFAVSIPDKLLLNAGILSQTTTLSIEIGWNPKKQAPDIAAFEISLLPIETLVPPLFFRVEIEDYSDEEFNPNLVFDTNIIGAESLIKESNVWQGVKLKSVHGFLPFLSAELELEHQERPRDWEFVNGLLIRLREEILKFFDAIIYVKPIRPDPKRLFVINDIMQEELRRHGFSSFMKFLRRDYANVEQERLLNTWMQNLNLGKSIQVKKYSNVPGTNIISEILVTNFAKQKSNLADMGFGISQVLPVLIECLFSEKNSTILIQQPELHLHPAAQAELGDLFILSTVGANKTFILETHSEHLILRVFRRIRETLMDKLPKNSSPLKVDALSVIVVTRDFLKNKSITTQVKINAEGQMITPWPGGFFEEGFKERFSID